MKDIRRYINALRKSDWLGADWECSRREALVIAWEMSWLRAHTMIHLRCGCSRSWLTGRMARYDFDCREHGDWRVA